MNRVRRSPAFHTLPWLVLFLAGGCPSSPDPTEPAAPRVCLDQNPERNLYWGDLHVHTALSFDSYFEDVRNDPEQAYAFAKGGEVEVPPLDSEGRGVSVRLGRPLDFAAVTDHAEYLAETYACSVPGSPLFDSPYCAELRADGASAVTQLGTMFSVPDPQRPEEICGGAGFDCSEALGDVWASVQRAASEATDKTEACAFTAFVGYEWSGTPGVSNHHRNVIFASDTVPAVPISYLDEPTEYGLWRRLEADCLDAPGDCDVLVIPHNTNQSNGTMYPVELPPDVSELEAAELQAQLEPLLEVYQHKGDSECLEGLTGIMGGSDELCSFEKMGRTAADDCGDGTGGGGIIGLGCVSRRDYLRGILLEGLAIEERLGVNPYRLGAVASTDTHLGAPGLVAEQSYAGHTGATEDSVEERLGGSGGRPTGVVNSPGGLVAAWATENSRPALFDAMQRREVYGTSGPRIALRFFGGFGLPEDLCGSESLVARGYELGVPMGGLLGSGAEGAPRFVLSALADAGTADVPGGNLERIQVVKGWVDGDGQSHVQVFDLAESGDSPGLDLETCAVGPGGAASLCSTWTDPDFDPAQPAYWYARVVEHESCRWSQWTCLSLPVEQRPEACFSEDLPRSIQERAWSSPIWYRPA